MEVHHPHHPTHKKKWSEYLLEFFMLFFAVTLGFFAENVREHQVVIERKNQNLEAMLEDLKRDSIQLDQRVVEYSYVLETLENMKYASYQYQKKEINESTYLKIIANKSDSLTAGICFFLNNSAYKNTISTGSLSVIESKEIKRLIAEYYEELGVKLIDNNRNVDVDINEFMEKTIKASYGFSSEYRTKVSKLSHEQLIEDYKTIPAYRQSVLDPAFRIYIHKFENRCDYYLYVMRRFQEVNQKLIKELENKNY